MLAWQSQAVVLISDFTLHLVTRMLPWRTIAVHWVTDIKNQSFFVWLSFDTAINEAYWGGRCAEGGGGGWVSTRAPYTIGLIWSFEVLSVDVLITGNWKKVLHYIMHIKVSPFWFYYLIVSRLFVSYDWCFEEFYELISSYIRSLSYIHICSPRVLNSHQSWLPK